MKWNANEFVLPRLHEALQTEDDAAADLATEEWEEASQQYQNYVAAVEWPDWLIDFVLGEKGTRINSSDQLHDAEVKELWAEGKKLVMVLSTKDCAWDPRKSVVVVEYRLASEVYLPEVEDLVFLYDQFSDLGGDIYRHYIMFNKATMHVDFNHLKVTRFSLD